MHKINQGDIGYYVDINDNYKKHLGIVTKIDRYSVLVRIAKYNNIIVRVHKDRFTVLVKSKSNE